MPDLNNRSWLVQIFLPLNDPLGRPFMATEFARVRQTLVQQFGGMTAWSRSLADGIWNDEAGRAVHDDLVIFEVMVENVDRSWWASFRIQLEQRFSQKSLLIRAQHIDVL